MTERSEQVFTEEQVGELVAREILPLLEQGKRIFALSGSLGAGKTTLVRELLKQLGVRDTVTSPTYAYMNEYKNKKVVHFDLYRLEHCDQFYEHGFDQYIFNGKTICCIEWPAVISSVLTEDSIVEQVVFLDFVVDPFDLDRRKIVIKKESKKG